MHQEKRHEDRRDADRHEPFVADVAGWMKNQALCRKLIVKLFDQRLERRPLEPQPELGDAAFEKLLDRFNAAQSAGASISRARYHRVPGEILSHFLGAAARHRGETYHFASSYKYWTNDITAPSKF